MATREILHRMEDSERDARLERAWLVVLDEVDGNTAVESILAPDRGRRLGVGR